jgi:hypothetical protein
MSPNLDMLLAACQRAGRDGVDAVSDLLDRDVEWIAVEPGRWDCHDREQVLETFRHQYDQGVRADFGQPIEAGDKIILGVRPYRHDEHGKHTGERLWPGCLPARSSAPGSILTPGYCGPDTPPATCATCGEHSAQARVVRDYLE